MAIEWSRSKSKRSPNELMNFVKEIRNVEKILGKSVKKPYPAELKNSKYVRKFIVNRDINKGEKLSDKNITTKRSAVGIPASKWNLVIGKNKKVPRMKTSKYKKICVIGSRQIWFIEKLLFLIKKEKLFKLQLLVTGTHLSNTD